jgi:putative transposase
MGRLTHRTGPGFTYFVTTKCWESRAIFRVPENVQILIECMLRYRDHGAFLLHEFVILPNHLHLILTPDTHSSLERAMQLIKGGSSHEIHRRRELKLRIWQSGFHEESIRDAQDYARKSDYVRMNPVRAGLIERAEDWIKGSACGKFRMDVAPERFKIHTSAAKPARVTAGFMSELKPCLPTGRLRPPKNRRAPGLKSRPPEIHLPTQTPKLESRPPEIQLPAQTSELKTRPPENQVLAAPSVRLKSQPAEHGALRPSAAKAAISNAASLSDLKVRPPKELS